MRYIKKKNIAMEYLAEHLLRGISIKKKLERKFINWMVGIMKNLLKNKIMTENEKSLYDKAIKKWGVDSQVHMAYEEMGELLSVLNKLLRKRVTVDDVITEIADVQIMTEQLALIFGQEKVETEKERKLKRLEERLNKYNYG